LNLSVVIPAFNEEEVISESLQRIYSVISELDIKFEVIVVDDGSTDSTLNILRNLKKKYQNLRILKLEKNLGHMSAIAAGLEASTGEYVVTLDADLQDSPDYIPEMLILIDLDDNSGVKTEVVQAVRVDRTSDTLFKRVTAQIYYKVIGIVTGVKVIPNAADFRLMTRRAVEILNSLPEKRKIYRLLIPYLGLKTKSLEIIRHKRYAGNSKYNFNKMVSLAVQSMISFTFRPLRIIGLMALIVALVMLFAASYCFWLYKTKGVIPGWTSLILILLSSNAFLFSYIGLLGEYLGRVYQQSQNRPANLWVEILN
jgi:glycosyltransferase involved in cell wall biosynthesis